MSKEFKLRDILTVTTGLLLTERVSDSDNGIASLHGILNYLTGRDIYTHNLGSGASEVKPYLFNLIPELKNIDTDDVPKDYEGIEKWLSDCASKHGLKESYSLEPVISISTIIPSEDKSETLTPARSQECNLEKHKPLEVDSDVSLSM